MKRLRIIDSMTKQKSMIKNQSGGAVILNGTSSSSQSSKPWSPKPILLPHNNLKLQGCVFDGEWWVMGVKKNTEKLTLFAIKTDSHGSDMHFCITQQTMINLTTPAKPRLLANQYHQLDWKISRAEYMKHYNVLCFQLRAFYSTIWEQYTKLL